jgi:hypothetical protein
MGDVRLLRGGILRQCTNNGTQSEQAMDRLKVVSHIMKEGIPRVNISCLASAFFVAVNLLRTSASLINQGIDRTYQLLSLWKEDNDIPNTLNSLTCNLSPPLLLDPPGPGIYLGVLLPLEVCLPLIGVGATLLFPSSYAPDPPSLDSVMSPNTL